MKKLLNLLLPLLLLGALAPLSFAQDESTAPVEEAAAPAKPAATPAAKKPAKKAAAKKKTVKKKKADAPVSEYKFSSAESVPTYKFDKKGNPIVKAKKKKPAKKSAAGNTPAPAANGKLKPAKPIGAEEGAPQGQQEGDKPPAEQLDSSGKL
jgi:outer membrane biosynthesis protein TonB